VSAPCCCLASVALLTYAVCFCCSSSQSVASQNIDGIFVALIAAVTAANNDLGSLTPAERSCITCSFQPRGALTFSLDLLRIHEKAWTVFSPPLNISRIDSHYRWSDFLCSGSQIPKHSNTLWRHITHQLPLRRHLAEPAQD